MMFTFTPKSQKRTIDQEIERLLEQMETEEVGSENYNKCLNTVKTLTEARANKSPRDIDYNTLVMAGANILGILLVLNFERAGTITSKAFSFMIKGKA